MTEVRILLALVVLWADVGRASARPDSKDGLKPVLHEHEISFSMRGDRAREKDAEIALAGAQIMGGSKQLATTNEQGLFRAELPDEPPDSITVIHTGQAPAVVPLYENLAAENELGTIELPRGATLTVVLDRRYSERKTLTVSVVGKRTVAS